MILSGYLEKTKMMATINPIYQLAISLAVMFGTQLVKKAQAVPINDGQKARIRTFVGVSTFILTALTAYLNGNLESVLSPQMIEVGVATGFSWLVSHMAYKGFLNKKV